MLWGTASCLAQWPHVSFGRPVRVRNPGGVRTKGQDKLPIASPPSCLPRPLPFLPAPSSFRPGLGSLRWCQFSPGASELGNGHGAGAAGIVGAPLARAGSQVAPRLSPLASCEPALESPELIISPSPPGWSCRPTRPPAPHPYYVFRSSRAAPPHPSSEQIHQQVSVEPLVCTDVFDHHTHSWKQSRWLGGRGATPSSCRERGARWWEPGGCVGGWVGGCS